MADTELETKTDSPAASPPAADRASAAEIDASCRWPLLLLIGSGLLWLLLGLVLAVISSIKFHGPGFLVDQSWLTLGRVRPAAMNCFIYGFATQVGLGVVLWMTCRLGGVRLFFQWPLLVAGKLWNIGVTVGVWAILAGGSTGFEWLEMPRYASAILFVAYMIIGACAVSQFAMRRRGEVFPAQWYLLAGLFWFPWIYTAANYLLVLDPVRGTFQAAVNAWYTGNFAGLWLGCVAIGSIFYFLPKLTGRSLYSRELAAFSFWTLLFLTGLNGLSGLVGGPLPRWMTSVSTAANVCLWVPLLSHVLNWHLTVEGQYGLWKKNVIFRFILVGAGCYLLNGILGLLLSLPAASEVTSLTYVGFARNYLVLYGLVGMVLFGAVYYIVPRLVQIEWPSLKLMRMHFICSVAGVALVVLALTAGGLIQGFRMQDPAIPLAEIVRGTVPFVGMSTLGLLVLLVGQVMLLLNFAGVMRRFCEPFCRGICAEYWGCGESVAADSGKAEVKS